jgi:hypothetical protein
MYVDGNLTTLEMLESSDNISQFVTKEEYQNIVQSQIQDTLTTINQTQATLSQQNETLNSQLASQQASQTQLNNAEAQQNELLAYNQQQQASYTAQLQANNAQINQLQQEEYAANQAGVSSTISGGACGGSATMYGVTYTDTYPSSLCNAYQDSIVDPWHMLNRECVSYTAWMASQESSVANEILQAHNFGNATDWPANAVRYGSALGVTVSSVPQVGDIAIRPALNDIEGDGDADVGHAMYVESVLGSDGSGGYNIVVSQYNEDYNGDWSVQARQSDASYDGQTDNLVFIHFPS